MKTNEHGEQVGDIRQAMKWLEEGKIVRSGHWLRGFGISLDKESNNKHHSLPFYHYSFLNHGHFALFDEKGGILPIEDPSYEGWTNLPASDIFGEWILCDPKTDTSYKKREK